MKTTSMSLYMAVTQDYVRDGAVVLVIGLESEGGIHRIHECSQSTNPREYSCKLEHGGTYHKRNLDTAQMVMVVTGE